MAGLSRKKSLIDTGFLYAISDKSDARHEACVTTFESEQNALLPEIVLPELAYLILRKGNYPSLIKLLRSIAAGELQIIKTEISDFE